MLLIAHHLPLPILLLLCCTFQNPEPRVRQTQSVGEGWDVATARLTVWLRRSLQPVPCTAGWPGLSLRVALTDCNGCAGMWR